MTSPGKIPDSLAGLLESNSSTKRISPFLILDKIFINIKAAYAQADSFALPVMMSLTMGFTRLEGMANEYPANTPMVGVYIAVLMPTNSTFD